MSARTKYIVLGEVETKYGTVYEVPIIFPEVLQHAFVADHFGGGDNVSSAGLVDAGVNGDGEVEFHTHGESISLKKTSKPSDKRLVDRVFKESDY
jgi:hypothetical protein